MHASDIACREIEKKQSSFNNEIWTLVFKGLSWKYSFVVYPFLLQLYGDISIPTKLAARTSELQRFWSAMAFAV